jgi:hypothetical protein
MRPLLLSVRSYRLSGSLHWTAVGFLHIAYIGENLFTCFLKMFPIAVITDEISQDLAVAAALVKEFGGSALEIRSVWEKSPEMGSGLAVTQGEER